jgi:glycosyltransferase involved in cell wall biosynthesis
MQRPSTSQTPGWICFSAQDWWYHNRAHSDFQLMRRVARCRPVLFINSIGMRMPLPGRSTQVARRILRKARSVLQFLKQPLPDTPGFHVLTPVILPFYGSSTARAANAWLVRQQVRLAAKRVGIDPSDAVVFVTIPTAWDVVRPLPRRSLLTNRSDRHSAFEETDQSLIRELENELLTHSDLVLYTSHALMSAEQPLSGDRAVFFDHGVDFDRFANANGFPPADLAQIRRPIVGFFGGIDDYVVDLGLLRRVAEQLPECSLVLIGDATCPIDDLLTLPNVHWLGFRPYEQIPAYGAGFDVALMPWLSNDWIEHSNPIKLKEYLALGLPVVSTDFPEVHYYSDAIAIARDADHFVELVREALDGRALGTQETRRARVEGTTWDRQADELVNLGEGIVP